MADKAAWLLGLLFIFVIFNFVYFSQSMNRPIAESQRADLIAVPLRPDRNPNVRPPADFWDLGDRKPAADGDPDDDRDEGNDEEEPKAVAAPVVHDVLGPLPISQTSMSNAEAYSSGDASQPFFFRASFQKVHTHTRLLMDFEFPPWSLPPPLQPHRSGLFHEFCRLSTVLSPSAPCRDAASCQRVLRVLPPGAREQCVANQSLCGGPPELYNLYDDDRFLRGQNLILPNGVVPATLFECGYKTNYLLVQPTPYHETHFRVSSPLLYMATRGGVQWQHFLADTVPKFTQIETYLSLPDLHVLVTSLEESPRIAQFLQRLGIPKDRILCLQDVRQQQISAELLILPCVAPPMHPMALRRLPYLLRLPFLSADPPLRNIVAYLSRNAGDHAGRRETVSNEPEVLERISRVLRGQFSDLQLVLFDESQMADFDMYVRFWSRVVVAVGPHGEAFSNCVFMKPGSAVIEFMLQKLVQCHSDRLFVMAQAVGAGLDYYESLMPANSEQSFVVDLGHLEATLRGALRRTLSREAAANGNP